jgi:thiol-disulfide isomerase/thioredoxin
VDLLLLVARLVLAAVFLVAGLAKLVDRGSLVRSVGEFGVPKLLVAPLALALPPVELAVAVALVPVATAWWGAVAALGLLVVFLAALGVNLARGRRPACHCFGQIASGPIGWQTVARNLALAALAGLLVWQGRTTIGLSAVGWIRGASFMEGLSIGLGAAAILLVAGEAWLLVEFWRLCGRLLLRIEALEGSVAGGTAASAPTPAEPDVPQHGLPIGTPAPAFSLSGLYGETLTLEALRAAGRPVLVMFVEPSCGPCNALMPDVGRWQREQAGSLTVAIISRGGSDVNRAKATEHGLGTMLLQNDFEVANAYLAPGTPSAALVAADGTIGSPVAVGTVAIRALVAEVIGQPSPLPVLAPPPNGANGHQNGHEQVHPSAPLPQVGDMAPALNLPDLDGKLVELAKFPRKPTLVLFWNPGCGFCQRMLPDLKAWEAKRPKGAPQLLIVSSGDVEANRTMGLVSPILLEQGFQTGFAFGVNGTPSAVLVDAQGRIASSAAVGADAVLRLARSERVDETAPA